MKRTWFQAQIKQDIAISIQFEHERHSTHKWGSYSILYKKKAIHKHIYPKATKNIALHLMSITSKVITSYLAHNGDQSIWEKHICMAYDTNVVYDTKMQTWYDTSTLPTEARKGKTTPSSPFKRANVAWSKSLVRISASCFLWVHGWGLCFPSQYCLSGSGTSLLCVWFWSRARGFWQH
jgi:hypothetical protein